MGQKSEFPPPTFSPTLLLSWSLSLHPVVTNLSFILERKMKERKDNSLSDHATSHAFKIFCYITKQSVKLIDLTDLICQKNMYQKKATITIYVLYLYQRTPTPKTWPINPCSNRTLMKWLSGVPCLLNQQGQARAGLWIIQDAVMLHLQRKPGTHSMQVNQIYKEACLPAVFCCNGLYSRQFQQKCHVSAPHTITGDLYASLLQEGYLKGEGWGATLLLFTTWTTPFIHFWGQLVKIPL